MSSPPSRALVVGLGGVTNGGKSTMCRSLEKLFSSPQYTLHVKSVHLDDYYRPDDDPRHQYLEEFNGIDWDRIEAIDTERFLADLQTLRSKCDLLFVEGFLIFNVPTPVNDQHLFSLAYYFDLPYEECHRRRSQRDDYQPPDPKDYFEKHVWKAYLKAKRDALERNKEIGLQTVDTTNESFEQIQGKIVQEIENALQRSEKRSL